MNELEKVKIKLNEWAEKATIYYIDNAHKFINLYKNKDEAIQKALIENADEVKNVGEYNFTYYDFLPKYYSSIDTLTKQITNLQTKEINIEYLVKTLKKEVENKYNSFIKRTTKAVGDITSSQLDFGINGDLIGIVNGTNGSCKIQVIIAGGYNIQIAHFRVLVHKIK